TLRNLAAVAAAAGGSLADVVKVSAFLSSIDLFPAFNATYERIFAAEPRPARTTTGAALRDILVEIDAVLYLPSGLACTATTSIRGGWWSTSRYWNVTSASWLPSAAGRGSDSGQIRRRSMPAISP